MSVGHEGCEQGVVFLHETHDGIDALLHLDAVTGAVEACFEDGVEIGAHGSHQRKERLEVLLLLLGEENVLADKVGGGAVFVEQWETGLAIERNQIQELGKEFVTGHQFYVGGHLVVGGVGLFEAEEAVQLLQQCLLLAPGEFELGQLAVAGKGQQTLLEVAELAAHTAAVGHGTEVFVLAELALHLGGLAGIVQIELHGFAALLDGPRNRRLGQAQQVGVYLAQSITEGGDQCGGLHIKDGPEGRQYLVVGQGHGAFLAVCGNLVGMVAKESVNDDGEAFGAALGKEVIIVNTVFCSTQLLYPLLELGEPVVETEAHEETDVQILLQPVVAGGEATGDVVGLQRKQEHVAAVTEDGHVAALHHEAQVLKSGIDELCLVFFHANGLVSSFKIQVAGIVDGVDWESTSTVSC